MAGFHTQIRLHGYPFPDAQIGVNLAPGITAAHIGRALTLDTSADDQLKLAGDGDVIIARLLTVEDRKVEGQLIGTAAFRFAERLPVKPALAGDQAVVRGSRLCGAGDGLVRAIDPDTDTAAATQPAPRVTRVEAKGATALFI